MGTGKVFDSGKGRGHNVRPITMGPCPPLIGAIRNGDEKQLIACIQSGQDIEQEYYGLSPIWHAVNHNNKVSILKILLAHGANPERVGWYNYDFKHFLERQNQYDEDVLYCLDVLCARPQVPDHLIQYRENLRVSLQKIRDKITNQIEQETSLPTAVIKNLILPYHMGFFTYQQLKKVSKETNDTKPACCIIL